MRWGFYAPTSLIHKKEKTTLMPTTKFARINSLSDKDVNDLFEFICLKIAMKGVVEVKEMLGMDKKDKPSPNDLIQLILIYDIPCSIKVSYVDSSVKHEGRTVHSINDKKTEMETQKSEITNPDLQDVNEMNIVEVPEIKDIERKIDPGLIPDFG